MKCTLFVLVLVFVLVILSGCRQSGTTDNSTNNNWKIETSKSPEVNQQIGLLKAEIKRLYSINPDSAIIYYLKAIELYKQHHMPYNTFDAYIKISELYCFRKNDGINAVFYYGEALKTMNKYGGFEDSDPFFYIDMGNMFYMHQLFPQAHQSYEKAITIATHKKDSFALSVAQNNRGIVFREERKIDSAVYFFNQSLALRKKMNALYEAQNFLYIAKVYTYQNNADSINRYRELASEALTRYGASKKDSSYTVRTAYKALSDGFYVYESELIAIVHKLKNDPSKAIEYYQTALERAMAAEDQESCMIYLYNIADLNNQLNRKDEAIKYASRAYQLAENYQNHEYLVNTSKLLNQLFTSNNNLHQANFYLNKIIAHSDSLKRRETSEKLQTAKILLITNQVEDSVRYYQGEVAKHRKVQKVQSISISLLSVSLLGVIGLLIFVHRRRVKLKQEHLKQMAIFLKNMAQEESERRQRKNEGGNYLSSEIEDKLNSLMETEKIYLRKNINLADLAEMIGTNTTYLSQYINNQLKTNFNDYINSQRINEACRLFRSNSSLKYSVDQIADMVGFSSRTTFYTTFKKFTGITPAFFQKYILTPEVHYTGENNTNSVSE